MRPELVFLLLASPFIGSFLALLSQRLPLGAPVITGRSSCPSCKRDLGFLDLIPLLSALILQFRCRTCGFSFGVRDSVIEIISLLLCFWAALVLSWPLVLVGALLAWSLLVLSIIDAEHYYLPDLIVLPLGLAGLGFIFWWQPELLLHHVIGMFVGGGLFYLIRWFYSVLRGREGLGLGDVKFACAIGAWVGWMGLASVILIAAVTALTFYLIRERMKGGTAPQENTAEPDDEVFSQDNTLLPFGPFLALGLWITWLHGPIMLG